MAFDPRTLLPLAELLITTPPAVPEETVNRTAANRCYYAALLTLKERIDMIKGKGTVPPEGTHNAIRLALKRARSNHLNNIRDSLNRLEEVRNHADYILDEEASYFSKDNTALTIGRARRLLSSIDNLPANLIANLSF